MNLESLVSLLTDPQWTSNRMTTASAPQPGTFEDLLAQESAREFRDGLSSNDARRYIDEVLTMLARSLRNGDVVTQPVWQLLHGPDQGARHEHSAVEHSIDAPEKASHLASRSNGPAGVLILPAPQELSDSTASPRGAVTGAFLGFPAGNATAHVPLVQAASSDIPRLIKDALTGLATGGLQEAPVESQPLSLPNVIGMPGSGPTHDEALFGMTEQLDQAGPGQNGVESLFFVPMRSFATGHLDQYSRFGGRPFIQIPATLFRAGTDAAVDRDAQANRGNGPSQSPAGGTRTAAQATHLSPASASSARTSAHTMRAPALRPDFGETFQGMLPARQNFLVFDTGVQKKLYVRDYFTPTDTLRRLHEMARDSLFDMTYLHVVINGKNYGRLG